MVSLPWLPGRKFLPEQQDGKLLARYRETIGWVWIVALAIFSTVLSTSTLFAGLKILGPNTTSVVNTVEPVLNIVAGILFLNEVFSLQQGVGAVFVVGALVYLGVHETRSQPPVILQ